MEMKESIYICIYYIYQVATESTKGWIGCIQTGEYLNEIVTTFALILQLEGEERQVNILADRCFDSPVTIGPVIVIAISVSDVRVQVFYLIRRHQVSSAG